MELLPENIKLNIKTVVYKKIWCSDGVFGNVTGWPKKLCIISMHHIFGTVQDKKKMISPKYDITELIHKEYLTAT